jgi:hypothetical protein
MCMFERQSALYNYLNMREMNNYGKHYQFEILMNCNGHMFFKSSQPGKTAGSIMIK